MYKIKINENATIQLSDEIGLYREPNKMEIIGIEIKGVDYSIKTLKHKIIADLTAIAEKQMEDFLNKNINNREFLNQYDNADKKYLVYHNITKADRYIDLNFRKLDKNMIIITAERLSDIYLNIEDWTYKTVTSKRIDDTHNFTKVESTDFKGFIYTHNRDEGALLLQRQLEKGIAEPIYYKCKKIHNFLEGKKTAKMQCEDKEMLLKDYDCSLRPFSIDENNNLVLYDHVFNWAFRDCKEEKTITLKHGRKSISFTVNTSIDDVTEG